MISLLIVILFQGKDSSGHNLFAKSYACKICAINFKSRQGFDIRGAFYFNVVRDVSMSNNAQQFRNISVCSNLSRLCLWMVSLAKWRDVTFTCGIQKNINSHFLTFHIDINVTNDNECNNCCTVHLFNINKFYYNNNHFSFLC